MGAPLLDKPLDAVRSIACFDMERISILEHAPASILSLKALTIHASLHHCNDLGIILPSSKTLPSISTEKPPPPS